MRRGLCTICDQSTSTIYLGDPVACDWHVVIGLHWHGRLELSNHVCALSVISMWHVIWLQHLAKVCGEQSRSTSVMPINHVIQMPQCLSGIITNHFKSALCRVWRWLEWELGLDFQMTLGANPDIGHYFTDQSHLLISASNILHSRNRNFPLSRNHHSITDANRLCSINDLVTLPIHCISHLDTLLEKKVVTPRNEVPFEWLYIFYLLVRSTGRLVGNMYGFLCVVCAILFNVYLAKFVKTFIDNGEIGEIGCMSKPEGHWMVVVANPVKQTFLHDAACWCGSVYAGLVLGIPTASCDNRR